LRIGLHQPPTLCSYPGRTLLIPFNAGMMGLSFVILYNMTGPFVNFMSCPVSVKLAWAVI
jgi:hypothetical protein